MPSNGKTFAALDVYRIFGIVINIIAHGGSLAMILGWINPSDNSVRNWTFGLSLAVAVAFVFFLIALLWRRNRSYNSNRIPNYKLDISVMTTGAGALSYITLTLLFGLLHFIAVASGQSFDPSTQPAAYARLIAVIMGYYVLTAVWLVLALFVGTIAKGANDRREMRDVDK